MTGPWIPLVLGIVTALSIVGFGVILPGAVRTYRQVSSQNPDTELISERWIRNAKLGGL